MKRETSADVFQEQGHDHSAVREDANPWWCLTDQVAGSGWGTWEGGAEMWTDPEREKRSGVARVLAYKKWVQTKGWTVFSSVEGEQGA